jgi:homoserine kinase
VAKYAEVINQFQLIAIMVQALKEGRPEDWINSFISINMHPKQRLPFDAWLRKIASCPQTSDAAFKTELGYMTIFDAMPNFWKA